MKSFVLFAAAALCSSCDVAAFSSFTGQQLKDVVARNVNKITMEYVPSGMSKEQWRKIKNKEKNRNTGKDLGKVGITSFKSRSFTDWQKSGGKNLFPVDPTKVKDKSEISYMQRAGGSVDGSDLKNVKKNTQTFFKFGGKKKSVDAQQTSKNTSFNKKTNQQPSQPKKKNWWEFN